MNKVVWYLSRIRFLFVSFTFLFCANFSDRVVTVANVMSDMVCCCIIDECYHYDVEHQQQKVKDNAFGVAGGGPSAKPPDAILRP